MIRAGYAASQGGQRQILVPGVRVGGRGQVQLQLRRFSELKSDSGHARYVLFRNAVGI